jgi:16S rRNA (uracil1498-N3)-methyltransferase
VRRFFIEEIPSAEGSLAIEGAEAKHIVRVLRMGRGDRLILMDGSGRRFQAVIKSTGHKRVDVTLERTLPTPRPSPVEITACQALLKSKPMDYLIQKTSELGINRVSPFYSERTVFKLNRDRLGSKMKHWRDVAQAAAKQSDRTVPAVIDAPVSFEAMVERWRDRKIMKIILWEGGGGRDLRNLFKDLPPGDRFVGIVGPEGGFSGEEVGLAGDAGFTPVSLGRRVLRAETAAITMVAVVQYEWGDLGEA